MKNHDFTPKNHIFSIFRRARAGCAPLPPGSSPVDDVFSIDNSMFGVFVDGIYPIVLEIKVTTDTSASYLNPHLKIDSENRIRTKLYDKRDDFNFPFIYSRNDHNWPRICSVCRNHNPALPSFVTYHRFVTRVTRRVPLVEQELIPLPEHLSSPPFFSGVRASRSLVFCVGLCRLLFVLLSFFCW